MSRGFQAFCNKFHNDPSRRFQGQSLDASVWEMTNTRRDDHTYFPPSDSCNAKLNLSSTDPTFRWRFSPDRVEKWRDKCRVFGTHFYVAPDVYDQSQFLGPNIHGGPLYWHAVGELFSRIYGTAEKETLKYFRYDIGRHIVTETPSGP